MNLTPELAKSFQEFCKKHTDWEFSDLEGLLAFSFDCTLEQAFADGTTLLLKFSRNKPTEVFCFCEEGTLFSFVVLPNTELYGYLQEVLEEHFDQFPVQGELDNFTRFLETGAKPVQEVLVLHLGNETEH